MAGISEIPDPKVERAKARARRARPDYTPEIQAQARTMMALLAKLDTQPWSRTFDGLGKNGQIALDLIHLIMAAKNISGKELARRLGRKSGHMELLIGSRRHYQLVAAPRTSTLVKIFDALRADQPPVAGEVPPEPLAKGEARELSGLELDEVKARTLADHVHFEEYERKPVYDPQAAAAEEDIKYSTPGGPKAPWQ